MGPAKPSASRMSPRTKSSLEIAVSKSGVSRPWVEPRTSRDWIMLAAEPSPSRANRTV